jgi:hypothetical protein
MLMSVLDVLGNNVAVDVETKISCAESRDCNIAPDGVERVLALL